MPRRLHLRPGPVCVSSASGARARRVLALSVYGFALWGCSSDVGGGDAPMSGAPGADPTTPEGTETVGAAPSAQQPQGPSDSYPAGTPVVGPASPDPTNPEGQPAPALDCATADVSPNVLTRLSRLEYRLTLKELFQLAETPAVASVPEDSDFKGFRTMAALQNVTTEHLRSYQEEATALAQALLADTARRDAVVGCDLAAAGCLESFIADFGRVAYRRTLSADDVAGLMDVAAKAPDGPEQQFVDVVTAMLSSPSFLFRMEIGDSPDGLSTLSGEELASRLSFVLIGRGPSMELLDRGAAGELDTEAGLATAAAELLADERSREYFGAFFEQWLGFEQLRAPNEPGPAWDDSLMDSMQQETHAFLNEFAWAPSRNFLDALTANHTYVGDDLVQFYGLPTPDADGRVDFPEGHDRASSGLLTHASLISAKGDGDKVAHRGAWVQRTFLCTDLQIPTALLDQLSTELEGLTYPAMIEKRNTDTACAGCHSLIDPIGVGFLAYDAAGQFDPEVDETQYGITPALPGDGGGKFENIGELALMLRARPELSRCLTERMFLYTSGRQAAAADACTVAHATEQFDAEQGRFSSILEGLVLAPEFRLRRAPAATN